MATVGFGHAAAAVAVAVVVVVVGFSVVVANKFIKWNL